jgi:mannosyltransferase OCH1-like enzyme
MNNIKSVIPFNIFLTWATKEFPEPLQTRIDTLQKLNPEFEFYIYDDNDCRNFIMKYFSPNVLDAYDRLVPDAYKADLWRCCVLYIYGGIYMDIKLATIHPFKLIHLTDKEYFVKDRPPNSIYNAFMVCKPKNILLKYTISNIIKNVRTNYYGNSPLAPTGPELVGRIANKLGIKYGELYYLQSGGFIMQNNRKIISIIFPEYDMIRKCVYDKKKTKRYDILWNRKQIYILDK